jgi:hypothetical protein
MDMSIGFGGAMKDLDDDALEQTLRAMHRTGTKRKKIIAINPIFKATAIVLLLKNIRKH